MISPDLSALAMAMCLLSGMLVGGSAHAAPPPPGRYEDLVTFFRDWRAFQKPKLVDGVPDYGAAAMTAQQKELESWRKRVAAIDPGGWPIPQQVDYDILRAELAGLDFDHRVLKPWANNPSFYVTVFWEESDQPAREGPFALGAVELWTYQYPLSAQAAAEIGARVRTIPRLLSQAKANLTGNGRDLWLYGMKNLQQQSADLRLLGTKLVGAPASLKVDVDKAIKATDALTAWLESKAASKTAPSGVGVENYDWYLKHVQIVPYTWPQLVAIMERELARS